MALLSPVERMLAWRYLKARRAEGFIAITTWFAMIGIMLGVATLILVTSLMNGVRTEMTQRFIGVDGHITVYRNGQPFTDYREALEALPKLEGVQSVAPRVVGQVMATANGRALGAQAAATTYDNILARNMFPPAMQEGDLQALRDETGIVLGERLAKNLGVSVGESVTLISPQGRATIAGFIPRMKAYTVAGTFKLGMHELDSGLILMPFAEAQNYFMLTTPDADAVSNIEVIDRKSVV